MNILIIFLSLSILIIPAYAEQIPGEKSWSGYPYVDPIREYYDARQQHSLSPPEPVFYPAFFISIPDIIECNTWTPVYGNVPAQGLLTFTVISGDYVGYANVSHNIQYSLLNYFYLPCGVEEYGQLNVTFIWNNEKDQEVAPETKVTDMGIDRHFIQIQKTFEIK